MALSDASAQLLPGTFRRLLQPDSTNLATRRYSARIGVARRANAPELLLGANVLDAPCSGGESTSWSPIPD